MKTEMKLSREATIALYELIQMAIEEELNFPSKTDQWMTDMKQCAAVIGEADRIIIE